VFGSQPQNGTLEMSLIFELGKEKEILMCDTDNIKLKQQQQQQNQNSLGNFLLCKEDKIRTNCFLFLMISS